MRFHEIREMTAAVLSKSVNAVMHLEVYKLISFKLGVMVDSIELILHWFNGSVKKIKLK